MENGELRRVDYAVGNGGRDAGFLWVEADPFDPPPGFAEFEFFVHRFRPHANPDAHADWKVSEAESGFCVSGGGHVTREEATTMALRLLSGISPDAFRKKRDKEPRFREAARLALRTRCFGRVNLDGSFVEVTL